MDSWYMKYAVIVLCALVGCAAYQWMPWCKMGAAEWASWVQAIGSIGAILGAIWVAKYQYQRDAEKTAAAQEEAQYEMTLLCYFYFEEFCNFLKDEKERLKLNHAGIRFALDAQKLEEFRIQFRDLPVHRFNLHLMNHVLAFRKQVNEIHRRYSQDISAETRAESTPEMILAAERNSLHEYWHRTHAFAHSTAEHLAGRGWRDPDGLFFAIPKPFRAKYGEAK